MITVLRRIAILAAPLIINYAFDKWLERKAAREALVIEED